MVSIVGAAASAISFNLIASLIWASATKAIDLAASPLKTPLKKALRDTEKHFRDCPVPFPISRIDTILQGNESADKLKVFQNTQNIQNSLDFAIALLDVEGSSLKEVPENVEISLQVVEYFRQRVDKFLFADKNLALPMLAELQKAHRYATGQENAELSSKIDQALKAIADIQSDISKLPSTSLAQTESNAGRANGTNEIVERYSGPDPLISDIHKMVTQLLQGDRPVSDCNSSIGGTKDPAEESLNQEIDSYRELIRERPKTALECYERLKAKCWATASDKIKFRITTNIGSCHLMMGDNSQAIGFFFAAEKFDPENPKALSNSALAYLLLDDKENARKKAQQSIAADPDPKDAYGLLLGTYTDEEIRENHQYLVPIDKLTSIAVAFAIGQAYRRGKMYEQASDWLKKAYDQEQNSQNTQAYALCLLEWIFADDTASIGGQIELQMKSKLNEAKELLEKCWNDASNELRLFLAPAGLNLSTLYRFFGNIRLASQILDEVLTAAPDYRAAIESAAVIDAQNGQYEKAIEYFEQLDRGVDTATDLAYIETLIRVKRYKEADELLKSTTIADDDTYLISVVEWLKLKLIESVSGRRALIDAIDPLLSKYPENVNLMVTAASALRKYGETDRSEQIILGAKEKLTSSHGYGDRIRLADALFEMGKYDMALHLYKAHMINFEFSHALRRYLSCCMETNQRVAIKHAFSQMSDETYNHPEVRRFKGAYYYKIGEIDSAVKEIEWVAANYPENLNDVLNWFFMLLRRNNEQAIIDYLDNCSDFPSSPPEDRMRLAQYLNGYGHHERALALAYHLCRENSRNSDVVLKYIGLIFVGMDQKTLNIPEAVGLHAAVTVKDDSEQTSTFVIESDAVVPVFAEEITLSHPTAVSLMGKQEGDVIEHRDNPIQPNHWEIVNVSSKYIFLAQKMADSFHLHFPDNTSFFVVKNKVGEDGKPDLSCIFKALDAKKEYARKMYEAYRTSNFPMGFVAKTLGVEPFQAWIGYLGAPEYIIKCCNGDTAERETAIQTVAKSRGKCVIDPLSLYTAFSLGIHESLKAGLKSIAITDSVLRLYQEQIDMVCADKPGLALGKEGDTYTRQELSAEQLQNVINYYQQIHDWAAQNCDIIPAVGKQDIDLCNYNIADTMHPCFTDIIMAANGSDRYLLSDDLALRRLGKDMFDCEGAWLQVAMNYCLLRGTLDEEKYYESVATLVEWGVFFIWINDAMLLYFAKQADWQISDKFVRLASLLGHKSTGVVSALNVIKEFFIRLEQSHDGCLHLESFVYALLNGLRAWRSVDLVREIYGYGDNLYSPFYRSLFRRAVILWVRGHFFQLEDSY